GRDRVLGAAPPPAPRRRTPPPAMAGPRSASRPRPAWRGVSTMLMVSPPCRTAVFLARIVMPFSRSRSPESSTRSATRSFARKAPDCHSIASTSVVLPWSTWATMATLRRSSLVARAAEGTDIGSLERGCGFGIQQGQPPKTPFYFTGITHNAGAGRALTYFTRHNAGAGRAPTYFTRHNAGAGRAPTYFTQHNAGAGR